MSDYSKMLKEVEEIAKKAGAFIAQERKGFSASDIEYKGINNLVSYVDKKSEEQIIKALTALMPEAGIIGEEGTGDKDGNQYNWVIDPLDGTTNFIHGVPVYAVSIALVEGNTPLLGVVYEVNSQETFAASQGEKATLNGTPIKVSEATELGTSLLATGFPYHDFNRMASYLKILDHFMQETHGIRRMGSAAIDLVYVACGRFEGFFEHNLSPWDVAAGALIVQQAGGKVTDFKGGGDFIFGGEILAAGKVHESMAATIKKYWG